MTDKPKRKRTPNRRRKFLLMVALPILALIAGFMALSPQIDTWLATDPFTPQCHFEQDRLFLTNEPIELHSINNGFIREFPNVNNQYFTRWSPSGDYFFSVWNEPESSGKASFVMSVDGEEIAMPGSWISDVQWSSDNRHFAFTGATEIWFYDIKTDEYLDLGIWYDGNRTETWSPNGRYAPISDNIIVEVVDEVRYPYAGRFIGWSADSQMLYSVYNDTLAQLNVETWNTTDLVKLPYAPSYSNFSISPDHDKIIFYDDDNYAIYVNLTTLEIKTFGNKTNAYWLGWTDDSRYFVYGELKNEDFYDSIHVYDTAEDSSRQLSISTTIGRYDVELSPSGRYIQFVREFQSDGESPLNYGVYDIERDVEHIIGSYPFKHWQEWFLNNGKEYFLIRKSLDDDYSQYVTTLLDMDDFSTCKIASATKYGLEFQPQP